MLITTGRSKGVLFECMWYSIKVTRHGPAQHGLTGNLSPFCEAKKFFVSAPNELKLRIYIDQLLNCTFFFKFQKCKKKIFLKFLNVFPPKKKLGQIFQKLLRIMHPIYDLHILLYRKPSHAHLYPT